MKCLRWFLPVLMVGGLVAPAAQAQTGYPMITYVFPVGVERGKTTEITVSGQQNFFGAYKVLVEGTGVSAEVVPPAAPAGQANPVVNSVALKVTVAPNAESGVREFRVVTPRGASSLGQIVIGDVPELLEKEPNNLAAEAQPLPSLPMAAEGRVQQAEDVDRYKFTAQAGEQIAFEVISKRLQDKIHDLNPGGGGAHSDPMLVITDAAGRELAMNDDYYRADPMIIHRFEKAGEYTVMVRDARYQGHITWTYRLLATRRPYLTGIFPMAGKRGSKVTVEPVGANVNGMARMVLDVPDRAPGVMELQLPHAGGMSEAKSFLVTDLDETLEAEPNNAPEKAATVAIPSGINGRISEPDDVDHYAFEAKKGQIYTFEVQARELNSSLDSVLSIVDAKGATVSPVADDTESWDSRLDWTAPADGTYYVRITDLINRGGPTFIYHITATPGKPDFVLQCDDDKALIGPGSGYAMYCIVTRRNGFAGEVKLAVEGLPAGVTATADRIPANMTQACVVLNAAPDAKIDATNIKIIGTGTVTTPDGKQETIRREAAPLEEIYFPGGGRGRYAVNMHTVSVTEPSDVLLKLDTTNVSLKPGGTATVNVEVVRQKGYDKGVVLDVYLRHLGGKFGDPLPPGVTMDEDASKTLLGPKDTQGKIVLKAAETAAPIENLPIAVLGQVSINFVVKVSHASQPVRLTVLPK